MSSSDEDMYGDDAPPLPAPNIPIKVCDDATALGSETEDEPTQPFDVQPSEIVCEAGAAALPDPTDSRTTAETDGSVSDVSEDLMADSTQDDDGSRTFSQCCDAAAPGNISSNVQFGQHFKTEQYELRAGDIVRLSQAGIKLLRERGEVPLCPLQVGETAVLVTAEQDPTDEEPFLVRGTLDGGESEVDWWFERGSIERVPGTGAAATQLEAEAPGP